MGLNFLQILARFKKKTVTKICIDLPIVPNNLPSIIQIEYINLISEYFNKNNLYNDLDVKNLNYKIYGELGSVGSDYPNFSLPFDKDDVICIEDENNRIQDKILSVLFDAKVLKYLAWIYVLIEVKVEKAHYYTVIWVENGIQTYVNQ